MSEEQAQAEAPSPGSPASGPSWRRSLLRVAVVLAAVLLPLWLRAGWDGRAELQAAERAAADGDAEAEIEHLGRALRWRAPLWSHDEDALERLWARGEQARAEGEPRRALAAYRELRRGLLATRAWGVPHRERFEAANERIAVLMAAQEREQGWQDTAAREGIHREQLADEPGPDPLHANLTALCFVVWVGCVVGFVLSAIDPRGRLRPRAALRWGGGALVALVAWAVLLATVHGP